MTRFRLKSLIDYFTDAPAAGRLQNEARLRPHTLRSVERAERCYGDDQPRPFGLRPSRPATALRLSPRTKAIVFAPRLVSGRLDQQRIREIINQRLPVFDHLNHFFCRTGCPNAATKSPGAILDDATGVGPQGGGQDARINPMDGRERRSPILALSRTRLRLFHHAARYALSTVLLLTACGLTACGFQLRAAPDIPAEMSRTYIAAGDKYSLFYRKFREGLANAGVEVVDSPVDSTAVFSILSDVTDRRVLSVSALNAPREYEVYYTIYYSVEGGNKSIMEPQSLTLARDYTYDETLVLGKAREEELLREAIVDDLVRIVLKQLSSQ